MRTPGAPTATGHGQQRGSALATATPSPVPTYHLSVRKSTSQPTWEVEWRHSLPGGVRRKLKRKVGAAWVVCGPDGRWVKRPGRPRRDCLDARGAHVAAEALVRRVERELADCEA